MEAVDIDKAFDDLVLIDQIESEKGYKDGYEVGCREAAATGAGLGFQRAAQVASEVGFYEGFIQQIEASLNTSGASEASNTTADSPSTPVTDPASSERATRQLRRARPLLLSLRRLIGQLPRHNTADSDVTALLDAIRAKFRQLCAVLRVNPGSSEQQREISF
ncbi:Oral cancer-overexpressed protein 1 [Amphibalanus amphitrite]|uniref:Oral cancer-overexpressed protein 1 n=1 Tax=Amphibalanus amphitrite TaxID=1232801 RepID=A0A6A4WS50_AMPAM|nr:protein LTO1 homolog [Amphibalanus amphitrite]XP_043204991.1 protein LTO1 homolog [Amphibalanus amphitrite]KAF0306509.1 Oral cancer-overexpressed protein 1 [Amphibalanus amphitrite]KAF0306510.1 Oral cancer-overexpressed protein 1 [Amphibalanus amphitrite]